MRLNATTIARMQTETNDDDRRTGYFRQKPVTEMTLFMLRDSICSYKQCAECLGCEYGKEWVRRGYPELDSEDYAMFIWEWQKLNGIRNKEKRTKEALKAVEKKKRRKRCV